MLTLFIESIKIKNPCQIKPQNLYDKDYQRFIKELGLKELTTWFFMAKKGPKDAPCRCTLNPLSFLMSKMRSLAKFRDLFRLFAEQSGHLAYNNAHNVHAHDITGC